MLPTCSFNLRIRMERFMVRSALSAGFITFTNSVWFLMNFSPQ